MLSRGDLALVQDSQVREHLNKVNIPEPMGTEGMHTQVLRELANVPEEWKEAIVNPVSKKGKKEDLESCQPVSSSILLDVLMNYRLDKGKVTWTES
ncbi:hypothetical protein QYF61_006971 [Mycteria americana]|uniref:Uncharacterized protein n=1 Tax=Mycteria americana TaxID=33587 RepID=A0AAN7MI58_MYCAM|nr:hypothetical protein QYF61_006971 [Mycteria americana]